jgi:hypothetical protein
MRRLVISLAVTALLAGSALAQTGYKDSLLAERAEKDEWIRTSEVNPFTAIGQAVLRPGKAIRVVLAADTILLDKPSADVGLPTMEIIWNASAGRVYARVPMGGSFKLERQPLGPVPTDLRSGQPVSAERYRALSYYSRKGGRVMAFDPELGYRDHFEGFYYYDPDPDWVRAAAIEWIENGDTLTMPTSLGLSKRYVRKAKLKFTSPDGEQGQLTLFTPASGDDYGFIPITDATSGAETYGGGRYLDISLPDTDAETIELDFNRVYNPYCAYTDHYNCPIPPRENTLAFRVEAGEKRYK